MNYNHIYIGDKIGNSADFFYKKWDSKEFGGLLTLIIVNEDICGKYIFSTNQTPYDFFKGCDKDYIFRKFGAKEQIDIKQTIEESKRNIFFLRRNDSLCKKDARTIYNLLKDCSDCGVYELYLKFEESWFEEAPAYDNIIIEIDDWGTRLNNFWEDLWKPFIEKLKEL